MVKIVQEKLSIGRKNMWKPRLASFAILVGSSAGLYLLSLWVTHSTGTVTMGLLFAWVMCSLIIVTCFIAGIGGIVTSFAIEPHGEGHFRARKDWRRNLIPASSYSGFCQLSVAVGTVFFFLCSVLLFAGFLAGFAVFVAVKLAVAYPLTSAAVVAAAALGITAIVLARRDDKVGIVIRGVMWSLVAVIFGWIFLKELSWSEMGVAGKDFSVTVLWPNMWPVLLVIAGLIGALVLFNCIKDTKVYRNMCPKRS